jgi:hypothetical protein
MLRQMAATKIPSESLRPMDVLLAGRPSEKPVFIVGGTSGKFGSAIRARPNFVAGPPADRPDSLFSILTIALLVG